MAAARQMAIAQTGSPGAGRWALVAAGDDASVDESIEATFGKVGAAERQRLADLRDAVWEWLHIVLQPGSPSRRLRWQA